MAKKKKSIKMRINYDEIKIRKKTAPPTRAHEENKYSRKSKHKNDFENDGGRLAPIFLAKKRN